MKYSTVTEMVWTKAGNLSKKETHVTLSEYKPFLTSRIFENFFIVGLEETDCTE